MATDSSYLGAPARLAPHDEGLHHPPPEAADRLWADTVWLSVIDPSAGVWGFVHMHVSANRGYGRFHAQLWIDGVQQVYVGKTTGGLAAGDMSWSDGRMSYEVLEPFERIRVALQHPAFSLDAQYTARHHAFDYDDCIGGSPLEGLAPAAGVHGGHYEQAMNLRGVLQIHRGPAAGQTRRLDTLAHRDHTWSDRFSSEPPWQYPAGEAGLHYWLVLQFPQRNLNVTGFFDLSPLGITRDVDAVGGFESSERGTRPITGCAPAPLDGGLAEPSGSSGPLRYRITFADGEILHVRMTRVQAVAKLLMRGEDDDESRLNDYEAFGDLEIEETGEHGFGVLEHSTLPPNPRWPT
jgi:hypothetical protein